MDELEIIEIALRNALAALENDRASFSDETDMINDGLNAVERLRAEEFGEGE